MALLGISHDGKDLYMITELVDGRNLRDELLKEDPSWEHRVKFALQTALSISYLHQHRIIHRDVKTENVLVVRSTGTAKLCDFGFSRSNNDDAAKQKTFCGSEWFEAPEIMFCMDYDERIDIFSYGVVLCEIVSRQAPSMSVFRREVPGFGINSDEIRTRANPGCPQDLIDLTIAAVEDDPDHRIPFATIIERLKAIYQGVAGHAYTDFEEELKEAEVKLQQFTIEQERRDADDEQVVEPEPEPETGSQPAAVVKEAEPLQAKPPPIERPEEPKASYNSSSLLTVARMQYQADQGSSNNLIKSIIPQKDQLAWRTFLVEFRSSVKVRDVQKSGIGGIKTFRNCFSGSEAVDWLSKEKRLDRIDALELCRILVKVSVIRAATPTGTTGGDKV